MSIMPDEVGERECIRMYEELEMVQTVFVLGNKT